MTNRTSYLSKTDVFLFHEGTNFCSYDMLGAHQKEDGVWFCTYAPHAKQVSVVGDFNGWSHENNPMQKINKEGLWQIFVSGMQKGDLYKYSILTCDGDFCMKADPYAIYSELRPQTASVVWNLNDYPWRDKNWQKHKAASQLFNKPVNIYELHVGSWRRHEDGQPYSYRDLAEHLIPYILEMGYTHIELMPLSEYPYDGSWGYQVTGYYAITSRFGTPEDFMYFVDSCHLRGIGVIMDWVCAHFPKDAHGLYRFDGKPLYEYADPVKGEHSEWGTMVFDFGRGEVKSFLISNAMFWMDKYHIDGLRVDAVASMLYLDYGKQNNAWHANVNGGNQNLEAVEFMQQLNKAVFGKYPGTLMIAEESTAWPLVTMPVHSGGLGYSHKWNMGWMNDMLRYIATDTAARESQHNMITFSLTYAFSENYILPISHDEVVHGKRSLVNKTCGAYDQRFAMLRAFYGFMYAHPGKKLLFMGCEFAQFDEWNYATQLDWHLLSFPAHKAMQAYVRALNLTYLKQTALWENDTDWNGFSWICADAKRENVIVFKRKGKKKTDVLVVVCNFSPNHYEQFRIGLPLAGTYELVLSSEQIEFGGMGQVLELVASEKIPWHGLSQSANMNILPLSTIYIKYRTNRKMIET